MLRLYIYMTLAAGLLAIGQGHAQQRVSGFITDAKTGERLIGATVSSPGKGIITDHNGYFAILLADSVTITFFFVGYAPLSMHINNKRDTIVHVMLQPGRELSEVQITATSITRTRNNIARLTMNELHSLPSMSGKPDVMKALQLLPGIMSQSEGSSLLLVRGGNPGENLYLFDNVPLIYVNHFGGFMSVFNPDIINSLDVYKGNFPARHGGKLSSIVNITQREGNQSGFAGSYHLGITDASLSLEGPLRDDMSIIFTGRKTLFDLIFLAASSLSAGNAASVFYGFHDINTKLTWKPNTRNSLHMNLFYGDDYVNLKTKKSKQNPDDRSQMNYIWGNWMISGGWKYLASPRLFTESSLSYTRYRNRENQTFTFRNEGAVEKWNLMHLSSVDMVSAASSWKFMVGERWNIDFGLNSSLAIMLPVYSELPHQPPMSFTTISTIENAFYLDNRIKLPLNTELLAGFRGVQFSNGNYHTFKPEPRVSFQKNIGPNHQINLGYMKVNQFSHMLFTPGSMFSNEVWIPAEKNILPSQSNQYTLGWMGSFASGVYESEVNLYYKDLKNLSTYKEGFVHMRGDENWRSKVQSGGKGEAWGVEFMLRKTKGNYTGFASYAWSRALRRFPEINQGKTFAFEFDRPHSISLALSHHFKKKSSINATWVYQSGIPFTPVIARQLTPRMEIDENGQFNYYEAFIYGERNSARMKHYHRMDISYTRNRFTEENKLLSTWTLGLYNAYNRKNPVYYFYESDYDPEWSKEYAPQLLYQYSIFPILPAISYKYYLGVNKNSLKQRIQKLIYHD
jgi:hypothetical protein